MCLLQGVDHVISVDLQPPGFGEIEVRACLAWGPVYPVLAALTRVPHPADQGLFPPSVRVDNIRPYAMAVKYLNTDASLAWDPVVVAANETCVELAQDVRVRAVSIVGPLSLPGVQRAHRTPSVALALCALACLYGAWKAATSPLVSMLVLKVPCLRRLCLSPIAPPPPFPHSLVCRMPARSTSLWLRWPMVVTLTSVAGREALWTA
jgi:hypothetical protein